MTRAHLFGRSVTVAWLAGVIGVFTPFASTAAGSATDVNTSDDWGSLALGYRYLHEDLGSDFERVKELDTYGPVISAVWEV